MSDVALFGWGYAAGFWSVLAVQCAVWFVGAWRAERAEAQDARIASLGGDW